MAVSIKKTRLETVSRLASVNAFLGAANDAVAVSFAEGARYPARVTWAFPGSGTKKLALLATGVIDPATKEYGPAAAQQTADGSLIVPPPFRWIKAVIPSGAAGVDDLVIAGLGAALVDHTGHAITPKADATLSLAAGAIRNIELDTLFTAANPQFTNFDHMHFSVSSADVTKVRAWVRKSAPGFVPVDYQLSIEAVAATSSTAVTVSGALPSGATASHSITVTVT